jgi:enoyl-CoA hydratase/carnithine racemase
VELTMVEIRLPEELQPTSADALRDAIEKALAPDALRGPIVLRGSSTAFCGGVSLAAAAGAGDPRTPVAAVASAIESLLLSRLPTIAVVEGPAVGGGVGLAAACDRVIATERASFALPELLYGLVPVVIAPCLRRRISLHDFFWLAMTGAARSAEEARTLGLVDEIVAADALETRLAAIARMLSRVDPVALSRARAHLFSRDRLHEELEQAVTATVERLLDPKVRARLSAFVHEGTAPWEIA